MMRCKNHPYDVSSCGGVCATCLRERLFVLIAAQEQAEAQLNATSRKSDAPPTTTLLFPRSVSPYVARRKSDDTSSATWQHHHHQSHHHHGRFDPPFFSTPQVGPTDDVTTGGSSNLTASRSCRRKSAREKFSVWSNFFARSRKSISDLNYNSNSNFTSRDSCAGVNRPPALNSSWFSSIFPSRRRSKKKHSNFFPPEDSAGIRRPVRTVNRGMSPVRGFDNHEDDCDRSPTETDYTSESWKNTPMAAPLSVARRSRQCHAKNMSNLAFCLSPLVRASPSRHWSKKSGSLAPDMAFSVELRGSSVKPHLANAASFCSNRSRKLVDIGKVNHNR